MTGQKTQQTFAERLRAKDLASAQVAAQLAALGYPGFAHMRVESCAQTPAAIVLAALGQPDLDCRVVEGLPWVLLAYPELDWEWLREQARRAGVQNRLGYLTNIARRVAELWGEAAAAARLAREEAALEPARLLHEDTLCDASLTQVERRYLREHRPAAARHWRLLTDIAPEHLGYATV